jgi:hypothetical protein
MILVNGNRYCTGSLVNTTANDFRPLFLTADHCLGGWANDVKYDAATDSLLNHWSFYGKFSVSWTGNGATLNSRKLQAWLDPVGTTPQTIGGISATTISGPSDVCPNSNAIFYLSNLPANATITWEKSANLNWTSTPGNTSTVSVFGNSVGIGWVKATVSVNDLVIIILNNPIRINIQTSISGASVIQYLASQTYSAVSNCTLFHEWWLREQNSTVATKVCESPTLVLSSLSELSKEVGAKDNVFNTNPEKSGAIKEGDSLTTRIAVGTPVSHYYLTLKSKDNFGNVKTTSEKSITVYGKPNTGVASLTVDCFTPYRSEIQPPAILIKVYPNPVRNILSVEIDVETYEQSKILAYPTFFM